MKIKPLQREEIPLLLAIRNDERTRSRLDNDQIFTLEQGYHWFDTTKPEWYAIYLEDIFVGYIRTTKENDTIGIGCDIHPDYRNQGLGRYALNWIIVQSLSKGIEQIWLQCFVSNENAFHLYKKLGFVVTQQLETRGLPAVRMELQISKQTIDLLTILNVPHAKNYLNFLQKTMQSTGYLTINPKPEKKNIREPMIFGIGNLCSPKFFKNDIPSIKLAMGSKK
jgi:RimJ/RimL family protein N-acetyltransferase